MRLRSNWSIIRAAMKQLIGRKVISERHGGERFLQQFEFHALRNKTLVSKYGFSIHPIVRYFYGFQKKRLKAQFLLQITLIVDMNKPPF